MRKRKQVSLSAVLKQCRGTSIVNVMVAFVVLLLIVATFVSVLRLSQNLIIRADKVRADAFGTQRSFYLGELPARELLPQTPCALSDGTQSFILPVSVYAYSGSSCTFYTFGEYALP